MKNLEELLTHADFVNRLARRLVLNAHDAADVAQETWLAGMRNPPASKESIRAWLAHVISNVASKVRRTESRRLKREQLVSKPDRAPSAAEVVERAEIRHRVVTAVLSLDEPYRSTILLRFYEDLAPREIAESEQLPVETVRTRLKRGMALLREKLDALHDGRRDAWCFALGPIAGLKWAASGATAGVGGITTLSGGLIMTGKMKIAIAVLLVAVAAVVVWQLSDGGPDAPSPLLGAGDARSQHTIITNGEDEEVDGESGQGATRKPEASLEKVAIEPEGITISGRVVDSVTREPIPAFDLDLKRHYLENDPPWIDVAHETVKNERGLFSYETESAGRHRFWVRASTHLEKRVWLDIDPGQRLAHVEIALDPGAAMAGRVIDARTGRPVSGALVGAVKHPGGCDLSWVLFLGHGEHDVHAATDEQGRFELRGLEKGKQTIAALHPAFAEGFVDADPAAGEEIEIRLEPGHRLHGTVRDDGGQPIVGVLIKLWGRNLPFARVAQSDQSGRYKTGPVLPGWIHIEAEPPPGGAREFANFTIESKNIELVDRDVEVDFGPDPGHVTWRGTCYDHDGIPLKGAKINVSRRHDQDYPRYERLHEARTDTEGRFVIKKLLLKQYKVEIWYPRRVAKIDWDDISFEHLGTIEKDIVVSGGIVRGVVVDEITGEPVVSDEGLLLAMTSTFPYKTYTSRLDENGRFLLRGLSPEHYTISCSIPDCPRPKVDPVTIAGAGDEIELRIAISLGGTLRLKYEGFDGTRQRKFFLFLTGSDESEISRRPSVLNIRGSGSQIMRVKPGEYTATITSDGFQSLTRTCTITRGATTELFFQRADFEKDPSMAEVAGRLSFANGSVAAGAWIFLSGPGYHSTTTDSEGGFGFWGMRPGRWEVTVRLADGAECDTLDFNVPTDFNDPFQLELVLAVGRVSGTLCDALTGQPLSEDSARWFMMLVDTGSDEAHGSIGNRRGSRFGFAGVPDGRYYLSITARGFAEHATEPFYLLGGQSIDLGKIALEPSGVLDIEVVDRRGSCVPVFGIACGERKLQFWERQELSPGKCRCFSLPLGEVLITVSAEGFIGHSSRVLLEPDRIGTLRIELDEE